MWWTERHGFGDAAASANDVAEEVVVHCLEGPGNARLPQPQSGVHPPSSASVPSLREEHGGCSPGWAAPWCGARPRGVRHGVCWLVVKEGEAIESEGCAAGSCGFLAVLWGSACLPAMPAPARDSQEGTDGAPAAETVCPFRSPLHRDSPPQTLSWAVRTPWAGVAPRGRR